MERDDFTKMLLCRMSIDRTVRIHIKFIHEHLEMLLKGSVLQANRDEQRQKYTVDKVIREGAVVGEEEKRLFEEETKGGVASD